jgi:acyl-CoA thioester hydrolase
MTFDHEYRTQIESRHIDGYGHVNNAVYLQLFEQARWDWIDLGGGSRDLVKEIGVGPVVVEIQLRFSRELLEGEKIAIRSARETPLGKTYWMNQIIYKEDGMIACKARFRLAFINIHKRIITDPHPRWVEVLMKSLKGS